MGNVNDSSELIKDAIKILSPQSSRSRCYNSKMLNEYDLINEYRRIFQKLANEYSGKSPSMEENRLHYLNEYTRLIGT